MSLTGLTAVSVLFPTRTRGGADVGLEVQKNFQPPTPYLQQRGCATPYNVEMLSRDAKVPRSGTCPRGALRFNIPNSAHINAIFREKNLPLSRTSRPQSKRWAQNVCNTRRLVHKTQCRSKALATSEKTPNVPVFTKCAPN